MNYCLITGASSGIGEECVSRCLSKGDAVVAGSRRHDTAIRHQRADSFTHLPLDLIDEATVASFAKSVLELVERKNAGLKRLILNAGAIVQPSDWRSASSSAFHESIQVNLGGHISLLKALANLDGLRAVESIVFVGSIYGTRGASPVLNYCAAKAGVEVVARSLARELAPSTRVNVVLPGHIDTPMSDGAGEAFNNAVRERTPMRRLGRPEEVAEVIEFLLYNATFISGATIVVDGGYQLT